MKIDIVIPTFNQELFTIKCLESIRLHTRDYRIVWVDNGSTRESREMVLAELSRHECYKSIWFEKNAGFVKAVNEGILNCTAEYVVLQNNDTVVTPGWIDRMIEAFSLGGVGVAGPLTDTEGSWQGWRNVKEKMLPDMKDLKDMSGEQVSDSLGRQYNGRYVEVKMVAFFSSVFPRKVFEEVGLLDECFGLGFGDDDDFCTRLRNMGYRVLFVPSAFVFHHHRTTFKSLYPMEDIRRMTEENIKLYKKKHGLE